MVSNMCALCIESTGDLKRRGDLYNASDLVNALPDGWIYRSDKAVLQPATW